jgi:CO/xanthine dehydrogenase Mo-binding subunit
VPIVPPPAALANAIHMAIGKRLTELPMSPPKVLKAILNGQK